MVKRRKDWGIPLDEHPVCIVCNRGIDERKREHFGWLLMPAEKWKAIHFHCACLVMEMAVDLRRNDLVSRLRQHIEKRRNDHPDDHAIQERITI